MKELITSKGTFLAVKVPNKCPGNTGIHNDDMIIVGEKLLFRDVTIEIPEKGFGVNFLASAVTEDQAKQVVSKNDDGLYKNYNIFSSAVYWTALQSFHSLLEANDIDLKVSDVLILKLK